MFSVGKDDLKDYVASLRESHSQAYEQIIPGHINLNNLDTPH